jgi:flavin reductase (DIM6/NTAB) family NADH-FMN oxidoreductase RutF
MNVNSLSDNVFNLFDHDWALLTAGSPEKFNTMTVSWGTMGMLWNKPIAIVFVRPQRYTFELINQSDYYTLSFFDDKYRKVLNFCGSNTGKNVDKIAQTGLTPEKTEHGIYFNEARLVLCCRKMYSDDIKKENIFIQNLAKDIYPKNDYHRFFVGEIVDCLQDKQ